MASPLYPFPHYKICILLICLPASWRTAFLKLVSCCQVCLRLGRAGKAIGKRRQEHESLTSTPSQSGHREVGVEGGCLTALGWQEREAEWSRGNGAGGFSSPCPACQAQLSSPKAGSALCELSCPCHKPPEQVTAVGCRSPSHKNSTEHPVILLLGGFQLLQSPHLQESRSP